MSQRQSEFTADTGWEAGEGVAVGEDVVDRSSLNLKRRALHTPFTDLGRHECAFPSFSAHGRDILRT